MTKPVGPYSPLVRADGWLVCSGQIALYEEQLVEGSVGDQVDQALANLTELLASEGATLAHVVKTTVFLVDMDDYAEMNERYLAAFGDHRPARSAVAVVALPLGARVEIEAWARIEAD